MKMANSTQFIGLNQSALDFVKGLYEIESKEKAIGMFGEPYPLKKWADSSGNTFQEEVQAAPWSSGPVILTHLLMTFANKAYAGHCFSWVKDPSLRGLRELDIEKGRFWI